MSSDHRHPERQRPPASGPARPGLTLLEMLLALAGTALVAIAIAAMTSAVAYGTADRTDLRSLVVKQKTICSRITAAIRSSAKVLAATDDIIVLWLCDDDASGTPNLSEIQRIVRNGSSRQLRSYAAAPSLTPAHNTSYNLTTTDFNAVTAALEGTTDFPGETWATGVDAWEIDLNRADPKLATLVSFRLTLRAGDLRDITVAAAALRNR
jgi:hypothetical protein